MKLSLRYKAAILISVTESILLAVLLLSNLYSSSENLEDQLAIHAQGTAELIASSATEPLLSLDLAQLKSLVQGTIDKHSVKYVAIMDHRGRTLAEAGEKIDRKKSVRAEHPILVADSLFGNVMLEISRESADASLAKTTRYNIAIVLVEILLVAVISLSLGWFLTRNLRQLSKGVESVGRGNLSTRVTLDSDDEVGQLARQFNRMAEKLQENVDELEATNLRFRDMADNTSDLIWEIDNNSAYTYVSKHMGNLLGYEPAMVIGRSAFDFIVTDDVSRLRSVFEDARKDRRSFYGMEYRASHSNGTEVMLETNGTPIIDRHNELLGYRGVTRDITRRKEDASRLVYLSEHDALTGLIGRSKFLEILDDEIKYAAHSDSPLTLLFIDLDGFKMINDSHGHLAGDTLLRLAADVLVRNTEETAVVARLGGDEFGIMLRGEDAEFGKKTAKKILSGLQLTRATINQDTIHISSGIGICSYPQDGYDSQLLLARADVAMSHAKKLGPGSYYVVKETDHDLEAIRRTVNWRSLIRDALEEDRLLLEFQPILTLADSGAKKKFEALVRLRDKSGVIFAAGQFITTAELSGQISDIDKWVLKQTLELLAKPENSDYCIAVNLSGRSLGTPGFCEYCQRLTIESGISPDSLMFEITETTAITEMARAENFITAMKHLGFRFSLDDFGVGFSSFSYLKQLPVNQLKIDGSFVRHIDTSREDQIFVRAIVQVAKELGLETVAEFVENNECLDILKEMGVDFAQGNFIGLPKSIFQHPQDPQQSPRSKGQTG